MEKMTTENASSKGEWSSRSIGSKLQHKIFYLLINFGGRRAAYALLRFVVFWYVLFYPSIRRKSSYYLTHRFPNDNGMKMFLHTYRMCLMLGKALVDRAIVGILGPGKMRVTLHGKEKLLDVLKENKGLILINAHVGCWQAAMSAMTFMDTSVSMLMRREDGDIDRHYFEHSGQESPYNIIDPTGPMGGVLEMMNVLKRNEILSVMGDRVFGNPKNSVRVPFLGQDAAFPISAFKLAAAHGSPCAVLLSHKSGPASYELELVRIIRVKEGGVQKKNDGILEDAVREFSETLEAFCQRNPYQFFNFFDMWE